VRRIARHEQYYYFLLLIWDFMIDFCLLGFGIVMHGCNSFELIG
jgi:hypothetical protein